MKRQHLSVLLATAAVVASGLSLAQATPVLAEDSDPAGALAIEAADAIVDQSDYVTGAIWPGDTSLCMTGVAKDG